MGDATGDDGDADGTRDAVEVEEEEADLLGAEGEGCLGAVEAAAEATPGLGGGEPAAAALGVPLLLEHPVTAAAAASPPANARPARRGSGGREVGGTTAA